MMKNTLMIILFVSITVYNAQAQSTVDTVNNAVVNFLKWNRAESKNPKYHPGMIVKRVALNGNFIQRRLDTAKLAQYLNFVKQSNTVSPIFLANLQAYLLNIGKTFDKEAAMHKDAIVAMAGLDHDVILGSFEPELIFENLDKANFEETTIRQQQATVSYTVPAQGIKLLFMLSRLNNKWLVDGVKAN